jgi:hypothetical protein
MDGPMQRVLQHGPDISHSTTAVSLAFVHLVKQRSCLSVAGQLMRTTHPLRRYTSAEGIIQTPDAPCVLLHAAAAAAATLSIPRRGV